MSGASLPSKLVEAQNEIMAGALAVRRIREHEDYTRWVQVGRALLRLQEEALHLTGSNAPHGRVYTRMRAQLGRRVPDLERTHKHVEGARHLAR